MSGRVLSGTRPVALALAAAIALACYEPTTPTGSTVGTDGQDSGSYTIVGALSCTADVASRTLSCDRRELSPGNLGPRFLIVGGQDVFVTLTSSGVSYDAGTEVFQADVTVENLLGDDTGVGQQLGTPDEISVTGVRAFFHTGPNVSSGTGTVTVRNADGMGTFTGTDQPYHEYDEIVPPLLVSDPKTWEWNVPGTVNTFVFDVFVEADVPHPNGYVLVDPPWEYLLAGQSAQLSATIRDDVNQLSAGSITWTSLDPDIAIVSPTGLVTAQAGGVAAIVASSDGTEDDGIARVTVTRSGYQIDLRYLTSLTASQEQAFDDARARWEQHLTGDVQDGLADTEGLPVCDGPPLNEVIDDLLINVIVEPIDGPFGILGEAGPCLARSNLIPAVGLMRFDEADLDREETQGRLDDVILHEMGHVLGFGTLWGLQGLRVGSGTSDPRYTGTAGFAAYQGLGGSGTTGVPLEGTGGPGTADGHWRESACSTCESSDYFGNELMTGFISTTTNPLSVVTIDQFEDLGYPGVDNSGANAYSLNPSSQALLAEEAAIRLVDDIWRGPVYILNADGSLTLALPDRR